jgi:hypothetical protein
VIQAKTKVVEEENTLLDSITKYNIALAEVKASSGIDVHVIRRKL